MGDRAVVSRTTASEVLEISVNGVVTPRRIKPVKVWALAGAICIAIFVYAWSAWILSGNFKPTPHGPSPIPTYTMVAIRAIEALHVALLGVCFWRFVLRPWRRERRLSSDGLMCIALATLFWQDPLQSFLRPSYLFNTGFLQFGSWANFLPGFVVPRGHLYSEPILFEWPSYVIYILPVMLCGNVIMRRVRQRYPQVGPVGLALTVFVPLTTLIIAAEAVFMRVGLYAYPGSIGALSFFHGKYYQYPIYEVGFFGVCLSILSVVRFYRDDKGYTIADRGIDTVRATTKQKTFLRILALAGLFNLTYLVTFTLPFGVVQGLYGAPWPDDITSRSYFMNGLCGPGTGYACPSDVIPIPHRSSAHVDVDGRLIFPEGRP